VTRNRRPPWPIGSKLRALALEAFVRLFSFPMIAVSMRDLVWPKRRCASCGRRLLTTLEEARLHGRSPNGLALEATPTLHRCLRCHELTVFVSAGRETGIAIPFEQRDRWVENLFPDLRRC
jgi:hypothetical protein